MTRPVKVAKNAGPLTHKKLAGAVDELVERDPDLARIVKRFGPPPMWRRAEGFSTLLHIILEQQVSLASARAAYERLLEVASPLAPGAFLKLDDQALRAIGFSRQKTVYARDLARAIVEGRLDLAALPSMDDERVRAELMKVKGIGLWTSDIYLLMALRRPDVWPRGDLALSAAVQRIKQLDRRLSQQELERMSDGWRPWRAVAARILWHFYLSDRARAD
jgi:DNA-3-methyladenine glycosylase II